MKPEPIRHAPIDLWRIMRAFIVTLHNLFGDPADIAKQEVLLTRVYKEAIIWVRAGEAFLRHLLLIEAAAYATVGSTPRTNIQRQRQRRHIISDPDQPESWRVSFRCTVAMERRRPRRPAQNVQNKAPAGETPAVHKRFHNAWPIAERIEAILRVFNDPAPYAKRLARKLRAKPKLVRALTRIPPNANNLVGYDAFPQAQPLCDAAEKKFEPG